MTALNPYATYLGERDPQEVIRHTPARLVAMVHRLRPEQLERRPATGKWNVREILCHLADSEIAFGFRLRQTLAETHHTIQPFDQGRWAASYDALAAGAALDVFSALRPWNIALISSASDADMNTPVTHPERGTMTFRTIVETMAGHDLNHLAQLERLTGFKT